MPARWLAPLVALALPAAAGAPGPPAQTPQALFEHLVAKDPRTAPAIRALLETGAGFVGAPTFADLTGDGRMDAVVPVRMPGAAGTVGIYVFSTDGTRASRLRAVYRSQALYEAATHVAGATLTVSRPRWAEGDDVCCPAARRERDYAWSARTRTLRRAGSERLIRLRL
jgi:hypothetical protein